MQTWFITGTDTEVGKSVVTASLARAARAFGSVAAIKCVASGVEPGTPGEDAERIARAAGHAPKVFATYQTPVSPHRAALLEGRPLDVPAMLAWLDDQTADTRLVEGVGGWHVPISSTPWFEVDDLARHLHAPVLVVAANRLGVLNHTRLTVQAIRAAGHHPAAVILNRLPGSTDASMAHNLDDLRALLDLPVLTHPPLDLDDPNQQESAGRTLWTALHGMVPAR